MKRGFWIASLSCFLVGLACITIGLAKGGRLGFKVDLKNHKVITADSKNVMKYDQQVDEFENIDLRLSVIDVTIEEGDDFRVAYMIEEDLKPEIEVKDGTLYVNGRKSNKFEISVSLGFENMGDDINTMKITVPKGTKINKGELHTSTGDINITGLDFNDLSIYGCTSGISLENEKIDDLLVDVSTGEVNLDNIKAEKMSIKTSTGDIIMDKMDIDTGDVHSSTGEINGRFVNELEDYALDISSSTGDITVNDTEAEKHYSSKGKNNFSFSTSTGDITLKFAD